MIARREVAAREPVPSGRCHKMTGMSIAESDVAAVDLTADAPWEYRAIVEQQPRPWRGTMAEALAGLVGETRPVPWPSTWEAWGMAQRNTDAAKCVPDAATLATMPQELTLADTPLQRHLLHPDDRNVIDLTQTFGLPRNGHTAYLFAKLELDHAATLRLHLGCDYWMAWWLDGRPLVDNLERGNLAGLLARATPVDVTLEAGPHVLVVRALSGNGGWAIAGEIEEIVKPAPVDVPTFAIEARRCFDVADPSQFAALTYVADDSTRGLINDQPVPLPMAGVRYEAVADISPRLLRAGTNTISRRWDEATSHGGAQVMGLRHFAASGTCHRITPRGMILGYSPQAAAIQSGPVLTDIDVDAVAINCRTNFSVATTLRIAGGEIESPRGIFHRWQVRDLKPGTAYDYSVTPHGAAAAVTAGAAATRTGQVRTLPIGQQRVSLAICADAGPLPETWGRHAAIILAKHPHAMAFVGDMVNAGRNDAAWDHDFLGPARDVLAQLPCYTVLGNHDEDSPLHPLLLQPADRDRHWSKHLGPALLIGIDGADDWTEQGPSWRWLDEVLASCDAPFVFVLNHYPAWSSGPHLRVDDQGGIVEAVCRTSRQIIVPLLQHHGVTAMFSGHDHLYERSLPPHGDRLGGGPGPGPTTCIVTGGAGAYLYERGARAGQNPHAQAYASVHHHVLLDITAEACAMRVCSIDGDILDQHQWHPRQIAAR